MGLPGYLGILLLMACEKVAVSSTGGSRHTNTSPACRANQGAGGTLPWSSKADNVSRLRDNYLDQWQASSSARSAARPQSTDLRQPSDPTVARPRVFSTVSTHGGSPSWMSLPKIRKQNLGAGALALPSWEAILPLSGRRRWRRQGSHPRQVLEQRCGRLSFPDRHLRSRGFGWLLGDRTG